MRSFFPVRGRRGDPDHLERLPTIPHSDTYLCDGERLRKPSQKARFHSLTGFHIEHGAEWGAGAVDNENAAGGLIVVHGAARRSTGLLRLNVYERLATDPLETYQLGHVDVPLLDVPVVRNPSAAPTQPISAGMRTLSLRRRAVITGKPSLNGQRWRART